MEKARCHWHFVQDAFIESNWCHIEKKYSVWPVLRTKEPIKVQLYNSHQTLQFILPLDCTVSFQFDLL